MTEEIPPIDPTPKPKSKGKKPPPKKLRTPEEIEALDVFKSMLEADAGAEASSDPQQTFQKYIHFLSRAELTRVERRIRRINKKLLGSEKERERRDFLCRKMESAIRHRREESQAQEALLKARIRERLEQLSIVDVECNHSGVLRRVQIDGQSFSIRVLINRYFSEELAQARQLLAEGVIVRFHKRYGGFAFVKRCIAEYLSI